MGAVMLLLMMALLAGTTLANDVLLTPLDGKAGDAVGLVLVQGAEITTDAYQPLARAIQDAAPFPLYVSIPGSPLNVPEPSCGPAVERGLAAMQTAGLPAGAKIVTAGHSLGGAQIQAWTFKNQDKVDLQILMAAALLRKYRNGSAAVDYPVPTLAMGGTVDGLFRITRHAENYHYYCDTLHMCDRDPMLFPTVLFEGMNHMQFASGAPPALVKASDLAAEIPIEAARQQAARTLVDFISANLFGTDSKKLVQAIQATGTILKPIIKAALLEANPQYKKPCNSDFPLPPACPAYPKYPENSKTGTNPSDCACGTPWSETAQAIMGESQGLTITATDAVHSVSDITPIHLPHVWNNCSDPTDCRLSVTTVTQPIYAALNGLDTGFSDIAATELRVKLVSRESILVSAGQINVNFTQTDVLPSRCAEINRRAYATALALVDSTAAASRFAEKGVPLVFQDDKFIGNAGPLWIDDEISFKLAKDKSQMNVISPCSHTPMTYAIHSASGFHYCKLISVFRAIEWIYVDSLRVDDKI